MKVNQIIVLGMVWLPQLVFADYTGPLLKKVFFPPSSALPEDRIDSLCEVYADKIVTAKRVNGNWVDEVRPAKLSAPKLDAYVKEAVRAETEGKIKRGQTTRGMGQTSYIAVDLLPTEIPRWVTLKTKGAANDELISTGARSLANLIELLCP
jgi:hypothetical protein